MDDGKTGTPEPAPVITFWDVDGTPAELCKATRGAARFFPGKGWTWVPAFSIEDEGKEITEAEFDALLARVKNASNGGK